MVKMTKFELGQASLTILQFKVRRNGMELRPEVFEQKVAKMVKLIGITRDEAIGFFKKYLLPEILAGCRIEKKAESDKPTEQEAWIAYRILKIEYFWDLRELRNEVRKIADHTSLSYEVAASVAAYIALKHLRDEFEDSTDVKLEITDGQSTN